MSVPSCTPPVTPRWERNIRAEGMGGWNGQVMVVDTPSASEIFARCTPVELAGTSHQQAHELYRCLPRLLEQHGAGMRDVVLEKVFFRDIVTDKEGFCEAREEAYGQAGVTGDLLPAAGYVEQPPCRSGQAIELQLYAVASHEAANVRIDSFPATPQNGAAKIVQMGGCRHLFVLNITGCGNSDQALDSFQQQSDAMFEAGAIPISRQRSNVLVNE